MKYTHMTTLLKYMMVSILMVFPAFSADDRIRDDVGTDSDISGTAMAPIDLNRPKVFETASFGIG